jgi:hypothetical protein
MPRPKAALQKRRAGSSSDHRAVDHQRDQRTVMALRQAATAWARGKFPVALAHETEAMAGRRLHDPPAALRIGDAAGAERLERVGFGVDVVAFKVEMQSRFVFDALHFHMDAAGAGAEQRVAAVAAFVRILDRQAERAAPELRGGGDFAALAIDHESHKSP